jgi:hypothetical protein
MREFVTDTRLTQAFDLTELFSYRTPRVPAHDAGIGIGRMGDGDAAHASVVVDEIDEAPVRQPRHAEARSVRRTSFTSYSERKNPRTSPTHRGRGRR